MKSARYLSPLWLFGAAFVLLSAIARAGWLYEPDVFIMRAVQSQPSKLLDFLSGFLSAAGSWELSGALLLALLAGLYWGGRRRLAGRLLVAFLVTGLVEFLLKHSWSSC